MLKQKLEKFIELYHLGKKTNSVIWNIEDDALKTHFVSETQDVSGFIKYDGFKGFENTKFGIYNTEQLVKLLSVLDDDINMEIERHRSKGPIKLQFSDDSSQIQFMLSDESVIAYPQLREDQLPSTWDLKIKIDKLFSEKFKSSIKALKCDTFTIKSNEQQTDIIVGYSKNVNSNQVTVETESEVVNPIRDITFYADALSEVIDANSDVGESYLNVSQHGIANIMYQTEDYEANYYLMAQE